MKIKWLSKKRGHIPARTIERRLDRKGGGYNVSRSHERGYVEINWLGKLRNGCAIQVTGSGRSYFANIHLGDVSRQCIVSGAGSTPARAARRALGAFEPAIRMRIVLLRESASKFEGLLRQ